MIDEGQPVHSQVITGWWKDTGKLHDMLEANRIILDSYEPRIAGTLDAASECRAAWWSRKARS